MSQEKIDAEPRHEFGKGAARRIRRAHKVPAVLYGHGTDPVHVTLPGHETMLALKHGGANALLALTIEGREELALTKQVQRHPVRGELEHVDLLLVRRGEKVVVDVPVVVVGEAVRDTLVTTENATISLLAEATHIPDSIEVSVEGAEAGFQVFAQDLELPRDSSLEVPGDTLVVHVSEAPVIELEEPEAAEGEEEAEAAEGEDTEGAEESTDESADE
jgi:large subunit ribosomal protein L25